MPPTPFDVASRWRQLSAEIMDGIEAWRLHHPQATRQEIETAIDARLAELRARMLQDVALASQAAEVSQTRGAGRPGGGPLGDPVGAPRAARAAGHHAPG